MALEPKKASELTDEQKSAFLEALGIQTVLPVLTEYPNTDATKAGTRFIYKGNEWHYMTQAEIDSTGWNGLVNVGFPAPIIKCFNVSILYDKYLLGNNLLSANVVMPHNTDADSSVVDILGLGVPNMFKYVNFTNGHRIIAFKNACLLNNLTDVSTKKAFTLNSCTITNVALNDFFNQLPNTTKTVSIDIAGCSGAATCTPSIATAKGYTIVR